MKKIIIVFIVGLGALLLSGCNRENEQTKISNQLVYENIDTCPNVQGKISKIVPIDMWGSMPILVSEPLRIEIKDFDKNIFTNYARCYYIITTDGELYSYKNSNEPIYSNGTTCKKIEISDKVIDYDMGVFLTENNKIYYENENNIIDLTNSLKLKGNVKQVTMTNDQVLIVIYDNGYIDTFCDIGMSNAILLTSKFDNNINQLQGKIDYMVRFGGYNYYYYDKNNNLIGYFKGGVRSETILNDLDNLYNKRFSSFEINDTITYDIENKSKEIIKKNEIKGNIVNIGYSGYERYNDIYSANYVSVVNDLNDIYLIKEDNQNNCKQYEDVECSFVKQEVLNDFNNIDKLKNSKQLLSVKYLFNNNQTIIYGYMLDDNNNIVSFKGISNK